MKAMWNIFKRIVAAGCLFCAVSCGEQYNPLPPKTDASVQYALPYPETPEQSEIENILRIREEHENAIK